MSLVPILYLGNDFSVEISPCNGFCLIGNQDCPISRAACEISAYITFLYHLPGKFISFPVVFLVDVQFFEFYVSRDLNVYSFTITAEGIGLVKIISRITSLSALRCRAKKSF